MRFLISCHLLPINNKTLKQQNENHNTLPGQQQWDLFYPSTFACTCHYKDTTLVLIITIIVITNVNVRNSNTVRKC